MDVTQVDLNQAISMVSYYASSSEPAQVRGKTVYIQYSNRHEIVNNKSPGDVPGNVLLVTIEGVEAGDVSIDVIHLVRFIYAGLLPIVFTCLLYFHFPIEIGKKEHHIIGNWCTSPLSAIPPITWWTKLEVVLFACYLCIFFAFCYNIHRCSIMLMLVGKFELLLSS